MLMEMGKIEDTDADGIYFLPETNEYGFMLESNAGIADSSCKEADGILSIVFATKEEAAEAQIACKKLSSCTRALMYVYDRSNM